MIRSFADKRAEQVFRRERVRGLSDAVQRAGLRKMLHVHAATRLDNLAVPPGNRLQALSGNRRGQHSIRVNDQYRICFVWKDGDAYEVELVDYH